MSLTGRPWEADEDQECNGDVATPQASPCHLQSLRDRRGQYNTPASVLARQSSLSLSVFSCFIVKIFCSILQTQSFTRIAECRNIGPFKLIRIDARQWCINEGAVWSEPTSLTYNKQFISISSNWMKFQSFEKTHTGIIGTYKKCH